MKIAISSTGRDLDAALDPRFGRCPCFIVVDSASGDFEVLDNPSAATAGGAGVQTAQMVANAKVQAVITGDLGPNATEALAAAGIKAFTGRSGTVRQVLQQYESGGVPLNPASTDAAANAPGAGRQAGRCGGGRRGMGRGGGCGKSGGSAGSCVCPGCGEKVAHQQGVPCFQEKCPKCGGTMTRA